MPKKSIIKELLNRRVPQIVGSYIIAGTSLVLFTDWLIARYDFPQYYVTLSLFCIISILPTVIILAYFHGTPGKDEWTKVEKYAIPINVTFIAVILFAGKAIFENEEIDKIVDNIYYYIDSRQDLVDINLNEIIDPILLIENDIEKIEPITDKLLREIWQELPLRINNKLVHQDITTYYPNNKIERINFHIFPDPDYYMMLKADTVWMQEYKENFYTFDDSLDNYHQVNIDGYLVIHLYRFKLVSGSYGIRYSFTYWSPWAANGKIYMSSLDEGYIDWEDDPDDNIKDELVDEIAGFMLGQRYGGLVLGKIDEILGDDLVSIEISNENLSILKGNKLRAYRNYYYYQELVDVNEEFAKQLDDLKREIEFIKNNPLYIIETNCEGCMIFTLNDDMEHKAENLQYILDEYLKISNNEIDSLIINKSTFLEGYQNAGHLTIQVDKKYTLEVIKVFDNKIIAKIINRNAPFIIPKVYDKVSLMLD